MQTRITVMSLTLLAKMQISMHLLSLLPLLMFDMPAVCTGNVQPVSTKCLVASEWTIHDKKNGTTYCRGCPDCPSGYELYPPCGKNIQAVTKTGCQPCIKGATFSDSKDFAPCKPCNICGKNKHLMQECELNQNRKCGSTCLKGFYPTTSGDCLPCQSCCNSTEEKEKHEKCIEDGEKHCKENPKCTKPTTIIIEGPTNSSNWTLQGNIKKINTTFISDPDPNKPIDWQTTVGVAFGISFIVVCVALLIYKCRPKGLRIQPSKEERQIRCPTDDARTDVNHPEMQLLVNLSDRPDKSDLGNPVSPETEESFLPPIEESRKTEEQV